MKSCPAQSSSSHITLHILPPIQAGFATEIHDSDDEDGAALPGAEVKVKTRQDFETEEEWLKYKEIMYVMAASAVRCTSVKHSEQYFV